MEQTASMDASSPQARNYEKAFPAPYRKRKVFLTWFIFPNRHASDTKSFASFVALHQMNQTATIVCPLCNDPVDKLLYRYHLDNEREVIGRIKEQNPGWSENDGACSRCVDYYHTELVLQQRLLPEIGPHFPIKSADDFIILPTGLRLDADPRYTGKGVTICFIDSGFYPHPDLTAYKIRIKEKIEIRSIKSLSQVPSFGGDLGEALPGIEAADVAWHGTMTSVVCAGDGYLSKGLYKGIASDAELVLLKVSTGPALEGDLEKALQWILDHHREYNIRIINISLGVNETVPFKQSKVDRLCEKLIEQGVTIVAAVGNDLARRVDRNPRRGCRAVARGSRFRKLPRVEAGAEGTEVARRRGPEARMGRVLFLSARSSLRRQSRPLSPHEWAAGVDRTVPRRASGAGDLFLGDPSANVHPAALRRDQYAICVSPAADRPAGLRA